MKKKIAIYANGFSHDSVTSLLQGINNRIQNVEADLFVFLSFAAYSNYEEINRGELNIYRLADIGDFDGAIVLSNMLNDVNSAKEICEMANEKHVPIVSIGMEIDGASYAEIDNKSGMYELVEHLVEKHGVKRVAYIGGTVDHPDSVDRLRISREVLGRYGYTIADDDIYYADWGYQKVITSVIEMMSRQNGMPDAVICANDYTALACTTELSVRGFKVPEDIIVTGFDYIERGKIFYPAITSVKQDYSQIGEKATGLLLEQMGVTNEPRKIMIPSRLAVCESCGCEGEEDHKKLRNDFCQLAYADSLRGGLLNMMEQEIENNIDKSTDYEALVKNLSRHYLNNHLFEGENFYLMVERSYFTDLLKDETGLHHVGYGETSDVLVAMTGGKILEQAKVDKHQLIPGYDGAGANHVFIFKPLHVNQYNIGYLVLADRPLLIQNDMVAGYADRIQQALRDLRVNMRLDTLNKNLTALYNKDAMTGLYNRFGYENLAVPMFLKSRSMKQNMMLFFVDINYMKKINDRHGHLHGDLAIQITANAIKNSLMNDWIGIRYGGDEFLMITSSGSVEEAEQIKKNLQNHVAEEVIHRGLPYTLSLSVGYVITDYTSNRNLQDYIKQADDEMYEIKRKLHAQD